MKFRSYLTLLFMCWSSLAYCGPGEGGGGGIIFACGSKVYLADTYKLMTSHRSIISSSYMAPGNASDDTRAIIETIQKADSKLAQIVETNLSKLTFKPSGELPLLGDDDIHSIPLGCKKKQLAIQALATGVVRYNQKLYDDLSPVEQALFRLHEAYVHYYHANTSTVRSKVSTEATSDEFIDVIDGSTAMVSDKVSSRLASALSGRDLVCAPTRREVQLYDPKNTNSALFPLVIRFDNIGEGKTLIAVHANGEAASGDVMLPDPIVKYVSDKLTIRYGDDVSWQALVLHISPAAIKNNSVSGLYGAFTYDGREWSHQEAYKCVVLNADDQRQLELATAKETESPQAELNQLTTAIFSDGVN